MNIFSLCFLLFINAMSIGLVFPIFAPLFTQALEPLFSPDTSLSTQTLCYSMILAIPTFCMIFGAPFLGRLSDQMGRRKVLLMGLAGIEISFFLSALGIYQGSLFLLFFSRALAGFMDGSESIAQAAIIDLSSPQHKARNMGFATFAGTIGFILGPVIGGFLAEPTLTGRFHYEIPFLVSMALTLLNALALYCFLPQTKNFRQPPKISYLSLLTKGFSFCFDKRIFGFSLLIWVLHWCLAIYFQISTLLLAEKFGYSSGEIGLFTTFLGACFSGGILFVIHVLFKILSYLFLLRAGISLIALSICSALYLQNSVLIAWISVVPMMLGIAMMYNVLLVLISNSVAEHEQGEAMGSGTSLKALGWLIASISVSNFYPNVTLILIIMLSVIVFALLSTLRLTHHKQIAPSSSFV